MANEAQDGNKVCLCLPYRDPIMITAQALSILAVIFSWGGIVALIFGLTCMIMLQVVYCCRMNRCGLNTAGAFACVVALINIIFAIVVLVCTEDEDDFYDDTECPSAAAGVMLLIGGLVWVTVATLVFYFANSQRFQKCHAASAERQAAKSGINKNDSTPTATAQPVIQPVKVDLVQGEEATDVENGSTNEDTVTTEIVQYPDGSKKIVKTTIDKQGNKTVEETIESNEEE